MTNVSLLLVYHIRGFQYVIRIFLSRQSNLWHSMDKIVSTYITYWVTLQSNCKITNVALKVMTNCFVISLDNQNLPIWPYSLTRNHEFEGSLRRNCMFMITAKSQLCYNESTYHGGCGWITTVIKTYFHIHNWAWMTSYNISCIWRYTF